MSYNKYSICGYWDTEERESFIGCVSSGARIGLPWHDARGIAFFFAITKQLSYIIHVIFISCYNVLSYIFLTYYILDTVLDKWKAEEHIQQERYAELLLL